MRKLMLFWGSMLLVGVAPLAAQNTVDVLGGGATTAEHDWLHLPFHTLHSGELVHDLQRKSHAREHHHEDYSELRLRPQRWRGAYRFSGCNERENLPGRHA